MKIYIDSVDEAKIEDCMQSCLITGITTTPTFFVKQKVNPFDFYKRIREKYPHTDLQVELMGDTYEEMQKNLNELIELNLNLTFKTPISKLGLSFVAKKAIYNFNVHLVYTVPQALFAAEAGARFICPLLGRMDDNGFDGVETYKTIKDALVLNGYNSTFLMASSIRTVSHVTRLLSTTKVDAITLPPDIFDKCFNNLITNNGVELFKKDLVKL